MKYKLMRQILSINRKILVQGTNLTIHKWLIRCLKNSMFYIEDSSSLFQAKDKHLQKQCKTFTMSKT